MNSSSNGDGTAVAQTENPPNDTTKYNESAILQYANMVLGAGYASLDGISDQELNRVYVIVQLDLILQNHPDVRVFSCDPQETDNDICKQCGAAMKGAIECAKCGWLDLPF